MISTNFINDVSTYTSGKIAKVVINDTYEINNFKVKEAFNNTVSLQYIIESKFVETVTKIDLKDNQNKLISTNAVNIPIASDTLLLQNVSVREAK
ncbi:ketopantoate hydroxymethyltransferase [Bacillus sp. FJAT-49736]|uniref:ketopantoate hydroxymethyltransferase n=1 Tax=Bacillus sp. FJAT-49736 TaxID=2833582 RepID=UPI001BC9EC10|nr:ketopantoate hydroxymethyltransferase [Bacillus sp. FJAT-49736]MBS4172133.1 ketopantoate hydroxymethyltransferase [Bacillus sp. FJAT-49736]